MENEEKELKEKNPSEEESDFADEIKPTPSEESVKEKEPEPEEQINLYAEKEETQTEVEETKEEPASEKKEEVSKKKNKKGQPLYQYTDKDLADIEEARNTFHHIYKKLNLTKWIITGVGLVLVILSWIVPSAISGINANITMYISLGTTAVVLAALGGYSVLFRKKSRCCNEDLF